MRSPATTQSTDSGSPSAGSGVKQYLVVSMGGEIFATPLEQVREVVDAKQCLPVPNSLPYVDGIVDLRGQILSVLDLAKVIGKQKVGDSRVTLVVETEQGPIGLNVEDLHEVVSLGPSEVMFEGPHAGEGRLATVGVARVDGKLVTLIDAAELVLRTPVLCA